MEEIATTDWQAAPTFGSRDDGAVYTVRPSAYGLAADERGSLALVRTPQGLFLPGGGIERGETPARAVERELLEECGMIVRAGRWSVSAVQFKYSETEHEHFEKRSTFMDVLVERVASSGGEADHELVWMAPESASSTLTDGSHGWAVEQWRLR